MHPEDHELEDLRRTFNPPVLARLDRFAVFHLEQIDIRVAGPREWTVVAESAHRATVQGRRDQWVMNGWIRVQTVFRHRTCASSPTWFGSPRALGIRPITLRVPVDDAAHFSPEQRTRIGSIVQQHGVKRCVAVAIEPLAL